MVLRLVLFLLVNFGALAIGGLATSSGVQSDWYDSLNKAPWTPPGWVFGAAWTLIMICFSVYLALLWPKLSDKGLFLGLFTVQVILNIAWNPLFFSLHWIVLSLIVIAVLSLLIWFLLFYYASKMGWLSLLILPYGIWLLIASSLNAFILWKN
jgi:tryptophan-rich sensory protein